MKIVINGNEREVAEETIVAKLLLDLAIPPAGTAVAVNGAIVPQVEHESRIVAEGDRVDVLRPIGGG
jgi:sulfur carrier protein